MKVSIIVSVFNEEEVLEKFYKEIIVYLVNQIWDYELIFVNDGSMDNSIEILNKISIQNKRVKIIDFSRNFGHEAAMIAGIDYSTGDGVICMDSDLQHPVDLIPSIIEKFYEGYEVITMIRTKNKSAGVIKNLTSYAFYKVLNKISVLHFDENASDFFALCGKSIVILKQDYREKVRFLRGYIQSIGFKKTSIEYEAQDRAGGRSKYSLSKLFAFSIKALLSFSNMPLKVSGFCGLGVALAGFLLMIYTIYSKIVLGTPTGYATIIVVMCFMFSILFILVGIIGEYLGMIFNEVKNRPIYIVSNTVNIEESINHEYNEDNK